MFSGAIRTLSTLPIKRNNIALVLHGCGVFDGSEIHEATSMLIHLSRHKVKVSMFAPNMNQMHVLNHLTGDVMNQTRNVLVESARLARGKIAPLADLDVTKYDALLIPGGFGAAKNLSNFAEKQADCTVIKELENILKQFHSAGKPMGLCCIAPVLAARCIPGVHITVGKDVDENSRWPNCGAAEAVKCMGAIHANRDVLDVCVDEKNKVVTTPAYMCGPASIAEVFQGIGNLVEAVLRL
ncbi:ES1 protein mitochondrial [Fasciolopsis buskii]|uniref:ES1 protein mitochondrial n=1 Tax=Fasciolopsis buskii TaxID=27845 RepID=A0A8E0S674_9TREM|nr:ES1 protein mitochondrial [Fasciolopsis buski]